MAKTTFTISQVIQTAHEEEVSNTAFLRLTCRYSWAEGSIAVRPNARPGEAVEPATVAEAERWVDIRYPFDSGLQAKLESEGYRIAWCLDSNLTRKLDLEGWEMVVETDPRGVLTDFRLRDYPYNQP